MNADNIEFIFINPRNSGNIGSATRALANFGFRNIGIVNMWRFDSLQAIKMAASAAPLISTINFYKTCEEVLSEKTIIIGTTAKLRKNMNKMNIYDFREQLPKWQDEKIAILFGSEKTGLTNRELEWCDYILQVPTDDEYPSLNLAQAVLIIAFEISKNWMEKKGFNLPKRASHEIINHITNYTDDLSSLMDIKKESGADKIKRVMRNILGNGNSISEKEAKTILWFLKKIKWQLENNKLKKE